MAASDMNVRLGRRGPATTALGARRFALARLLLFLTGLVQLDRKLLLLLAVPPMSACIIPVGPEFQDPLGVTNSTPEIISTDPPNGLIVSALKPTFTVIANDADNDALHFRLIADYPDQTGLLNPTHHILLQKDFPPGIAVFDKTVDCFIDNVDHTLASHRITVVVADRAFVEDSTDFTAVGPGGRVVMRWWFWDVSCAPPTPPPPTEMLP